LDALTPEEARTVRRLRRRMTENERLRGIKILRLAATQLERGKPDKALQAVLSGFGGIMLRGLVQKIHKRLT